MNNMTMSHRTMVPRLARATVCIASSAALAACGIPPLESKPTPPVQRLGQPVSLGINGFNYTDTVISYFSVAGQGGGNIYVSSPTSGGGGTTCCVTWFPGTPLPKPIEVEWMRSIDGKRRWCKRTVQLTGPVPDRPTAIGVHFMPDGDIQVELAVGYPKLKLRLENYDDGNRRETGNLISDEKFANCSYTS